MGVPAGSIKQGKTAFINSLPVRGYVKIWNEFFRDQNIDNPATLRINDQNESYQT